MSRWNARPTQQLARIEVEPIITLQNLPTATLIIDGSGRVLHFNERASVLLERHGSMLYGMRVAELLGRDLLGQASASATTFPLNVALPSGRRISVTVAVSPVTESSQNTHLIVALTPSSVENQPWIEKVPRIAPWADVAELVAGLDCDALCIAIGLVGLRSVNESFSRSAGDTVITELARRLMSITPTGTVVERISGDRFIIVSPIEGDNDRRVAHIMRAVREPIDTRLGAAVVGCAAGVTTGRSSPSLVLLDRADRNLSVALGRGVDTIEWNDMPRPRLLQTGARLGAPLRAGVAKRAISAHFQPVIELATGDVVEYEALARWLDDEGNHHLAAHFIGVAEDTGVVRDVGVQILRSALELATHLSNVLGRATLPRVSVNVAASELADVSFADRVIVELTAAEVPADLLQFELTDSVGPEQADYVRSTITQLRRTGVRFALDGFGGQSANLLSLTDFEFDVVKLDRRLIHDALGDPRSLSLLRAVMGLAEQLGVEVIAKGIETTGQHQLLLEVGCRFGEGFLYSPPLPMEKLEIGAQFHVGAMLAAS
jgi:predicted signal transduction protein with EAL and GGDEF domain